MYHSAIAKFTTIDPKGMPISYDTGIMVGERDESFVYVEPEVGNAISSTIVRQLRSGATSHSEMLSLRFNHDFLHFANSKYSLGCCKLACIKRPLETLPLRRINIPQNLGQSKGNVSSATL
jgi:hypothetical protein